ncbi:hypothetical protein LMH87_012312 [Akanthomyces muscarius]|uniref:Uncharacterized protein n=1 Tax=Akanthomyces muscarius TaxID=2231603 RepID=A0A9W8QD33_AKAMU|nr:hypothetical protein LMH87_012312 [Akanthomyces muscarius]KAJ4151622.1 hypothetical protein LMH87_012312 [Akanthomyces muscarius]
MPKKPRAATVVGAPLGGLARGISCCRGSESFGWSMSTTLKKRCIVTENLVGVFPAAHVQRNKTPKTASTTRFKGKAQ